MKTPMRRRNIKLSDDQKETESLVGFHTASRDVCTAIEDDNDENIKSFATLPKTVLVWKHSKSFLLGACQGYRRLAVLNGLLFECYRDSYNELVQKIKSYLDDPEPEDLIQKYETIKQQFQQLTEYLEKLQQEKSARYKMRRQQHDDRKKIYQMCKEQGMTDADAYREIISIEEPNLKPGTASYISAMNRLKMWKSRHKKEM